MAKAKRSDKGEGSVYQSKNGSWVAEIRTGGKRKVFYGKAESEVKKKLKAYKTELIKNDYVEVKKRTVKDYMDDWLYNTQVHTLKPKSFDLKEGTLQNQIYPYIGNLQMGNVTSNDIQRLINDLVAKKLSYSTIRKAYDALNACFKLGILKSELVKNPCAGVVLPSNSKKSMSDIRFFDDDEIKKICEESLRKYNTGKNFYRLGNAIILMLYTGIRVGECLALKWTDINWDKKTIHVHANAVEVINRERRIEDSDKKYIILYQDTTKTEAGHRYVHLNQKAVNALLALKEVNGKHEYVACSQTGKLQGHKNIDRMFDCILTHCNINPCGVHALRHTFASMLFKKGVDVKTVSELLGHKDVSVEHRRFPIG